MTPKELTRKIKGLPGFLQTIVPRIFESWDTIMVDMNVDQMLAGKDSLDRNINKAGNTDYDPDYAEYKSQIYGGQTEYIDLHLTGDFHSSLDVKITGESIEFFATDPKTDALIKIYGSEIFGLNDDNFDEVFDGVSAELVQELTAYFA